MAAATAAHPAVAAGRGSTTISSLAVQCGESRLVIALLQAGSHLHLKVVEMSPGMAVLGENFSQAAQLQADQATLMLRLSSKQSPVEELLRQADDLILTQTPKAEVYAAMAESLGAAWRDLHILLDRRKTLLDTNYSFQGHLQEFHQKASSLLKLCHEAETGAEPGGAGGAEAAAESLLAGLAQARKLVLEAAVFTLQEGESLLEALQLLQLQSVDSRTEHCSSQAARAKHQVELWLEGLHDSRVSVMAAQTTSAQLLSRRVSSLRVAGKIDELSGRLRQERQHLLRTDQLGSSIEEVQLLLTEVSRMEKEAHQVSDRCMKAVKVSQGFNSGQQPLSMECSIRAYAALEQSAEYQQLLDNRKFLLNSAMEFFELARSAMTSLQHIEMEVTGLSLEGGSGLVEELGRKTRELVARLEEEGGQLAERAGGGPGTLGVRRVIAEVSCQGEKVLQACASVQHKATTGARERREVLSRAEELLTWVTTETQTLVRQGGPSSNTQEGVAKYQAQHTGLMTRVSNRMHEVEALEKDPLLRKLEGNDKIHATIQRVQEAFRSSTSLIESRLRIAEQMDRFLRIARQLTEEMTRLEERLGDGRSAQQTSDYEESRAKIQQLYLQVCNIGKNLKEDMERTEPKEQNRIPGPADFIMVIEKHLETFTHKQTVIIEKWSKVEVTRKELLRNDELWEKVQKDASTALALARELEAQLYPIFQGPGPLSSPLPQLASLQAKLPHMQRLPARMEENACQAKQLASAGGDEAEEAAKLRDVLNKEARDVHTSLEEYSETLTLITAFIKSLNKVEGLLTSQESKKSDLPLKLQDAEKAKQDAVTEKATLEKLVQFCGEELESLDMRLGRMGSAALLKKDLDLLRDLLKGLKGRVSEGGEGQVEELSYWVKLLQWQEEREGLERELVSLLAAVSCLARGKATSGEVLERERREVCKVARRVEQEVMRLLEEGKILKHSLPKYDSRVGGEMAGMEAQLVSLREALAAAEERMVLHASYWERLGEARKQLEETNRHLLAWSQAVTSGNFCQERARQLRKEMQNYRIEIRTESYNELVLLGRQVGEEDSHLSRERLEALSKVDMFIVKLTTLEEELVRKAKEEEETRIRKLEEEREVTRRKKKEEDMFLKEQDRLKKVRDQQEKKKKEDEENLMKTIRQREEEIFKMKKEEAERKAKQQCKEEEERTKSIKEEEEKKRIFREEEERKRIIQEDENKRRIIQEEAEKKIRILQEEERKRISREEEERKRIIREKEEQETRLRIQREEANIQKIQAAADESARVAREEAEVARRAAHQAEEARLAVELLNKQKAEVARQSHETQTEEEVAPVRPPPPEEEEEPRPVAPIFTEGLQDLVLDEGVGCVLYATVSGIPPPNITWFKDGIPVASNTDYMTECSGGACSLAIEETLREDSANWTCRASNPAGYAESHAKLTVREARMPEPVEPEPHKPAFYVPLSNTVCQEQGEAVLECVIIGWPEPEVIWYQEDAPVRESLSCQLQFQGDTCRLLLSRVTLAQGGNYTVRAVNQCGECRSTCRLSVDAVPQILTSTHSTIVTKQITSKTVAVSKKVVKPSFVTPVQGCMVEEGERVVLEATLTGSPEPKLTWWRGKAEVVSNDRLQVTVYRGKTCLTIEKTREGDGGKYCCRAENPGGTVESLVDLVVRRKSLSPVFLRRLQAHSVLAGGRLLLEVEVGGLPPPKVSWWQGGHCLVPGQGVQCREEEGRHSLVIHSVEERHGGKYTVQAANAAGEAASVADITILPSSSQKEIETSLSRSASPLTSSALSLGPESAALRTLAAHHRAPRPLPDLLPFPFKPDNVITNRPRKNNSKVPKPSKFQVGEMYHSDYESDLEGRIPVYWKPAHSDSEDLDVAHRSIRPVLIEGRIWEDRRPSPPCPHVWESHEEIDKMQRELKFQGGKRRQVAEKEGRRQDQELQRQMEEQDNYRQEQELQRQKQMNQRQAQEHDRHELELHRQVEYEDQKRVEEEWRQNQIVEKNERNNKEQEHLLFLEEEKQRHIEEEKIRETTYKNIQTEKDQRMKSEKERQRQIDEKTLKEKEIIIKMQEQQQKIIMETRKKIIIDEEAKTNYLKEQQQECALEQKKKDRLEKDKNERQEQERRVQKQKEEADCIALKLIAEQMVESQRVLITSSITSTVEKSSKLTETSNEEPVYYQATATAVSRSSSRIERGEEFLPPPLPPKARGSALTPSPSFADSGSFSDETITSQSTVRTDKFIRVKEKVQMLERKLEEDALRLEEDEEGDSSGRTSRGGALRPENIPGAIRILPTPTPPNSRPASQASSRKSSLTRSNSMDGSSNRPGFFSPVNVARSLQQSPAFCRKHLETPPPMYKPPDPDILAQSIRMESRKISDMFSWEDKSEPAADVKKRISFSEALPHVSLEQASGKIYQESRSRETKTTFTTSSTTEVHSTVEESSPPPRPPPPKYGEIAYGELHFTGLQSGVDSNKPEYSEDTSFKGRETDRAGSESQDLCGASTATSRRSTGPSGHTTSYTSPPPLESVPLVMAARESIDREIRSRRQSEDRENIYWRTLEAPGEGREEVKDGGYEGDTDTSPRRRGSVRQMAARFDQREVSAPSPPPFRSSRASSSVQSPEPHFSSSSAYLPPTWAPPPVTKVIRINQQSLSTATTTSTSTKPIFSSLPCFPAAPLPSPASPQPPSLLAAQLQDLSQPCTAPSPKIFCPTRFIPRTESGSSIDYSSPKTEIRSRWTPSPSGQADPSYRPVRLNLREPKVGTETSSTSTSGPTSICSTAGHDEQAQGDGLVYVKWDFDCEVGVLNTAAGGGR